MISLLHKRSFILIYAMTYCCCAVFTSKAQCNIGGSFSSLCRNNQTHSLDSFFRLNGVAPSTGSYSLHSFNGNTSHGYVSAFALSGARAFKGDWPGGIWCFQYNAPCGSSDTLSIELKDEDMVNATLKKNMRFCSALDTFPLSAMVETAVPGGGNWIWTGKTSNHLLLLPRESDSLWSGYRYLMGIYTSPLGCSDTAYTIYTIRNKPVAEILNYQPNKLCENDSLKLTAFFKATGSINWTTLNFSDGQFSNVLSPTTTYFHGKTDLAGKSVQIVLSSQALTGDVCPVATDTLRVELSAFPIPGMGDSIRICQHGAGSIVGFEKTKIPGAHLKYEWRCNPGNVVDSGIFFSRKFSQQGKYDLSVTVTNIKNGCKATLTKNEWIWVLPVPKADFGLKNSDIAMVYNPKFFFENKSSIDKSYFKNAKLDFEWIFENWRFRETRSDPSPTFISPPDTGYIQVTLIVTGQANCIDSAKGKIYVAGNPWALMPTAFSPDEEGPRLNNHYMVQMGYAKDVKLSIFNTWGEKLFYTEDITRGWDGKYKGHECPQGVYIAAAEVKDLIGYRHIFSQSFHLLR